MAKYMQDSERIISVCYGILYKHKKEIIFVIYTATYYMIWSFIAIDV